MLRLRQDDNEHCISVKGVKALLGIIEDEVNAAALSSLSGSNDPVYKVTFKFVSPTSTKGVVLLVY